MKPISGAVLDTINTRIGVEPILVVGILWARVIHWFASKEAFGYRPIIISCSECSNERRNDHSSNSSALTVTLDDSDGALKGILDILLTEQAECRAFLAFEGLPVNQSVPLLYGRVAGPIRYDEGQRTLTLTLESTTKINEAGFAPSDEFPDLAADAIGVPWPMIFGKVAHVPAVRVRKQTTGYLKTPIRLNSGVFRMGANQTLLLDGNCHVQSYFSSTTVEVDKIFVRDGDLFPQGFEVQIIIDGVIFKGIFHGEVFTVTQANVPTYTNITFSPRSDVPDVYAASYNFAALPEDVNVSGHYVYIKTVAPNVWVNYVAKQEGRIIEFRDIPVDPVTKQYAFLGAPRIIEAAYPVMKSGLVGQAAHQLEDLLTVIQQGYKEAGKDRAGLLQSALNQIYQSTEIFWQSPAETEVKIFDLADPEIYVASAVQLASIDAVYGHKSVAFPDGHVRKLLSPIPQSYYTVQLRSNYPINNAFASGLIFPRPLSDYKEEGWDDKVYVTATSTVGPNVADIIHYLLDTYAPDLKALKHSFQQAASNTDPVNFAIAERRDAVELCTDIAWQARCALRTDSEHIELIFLDREPSSVATFSEVNVLRDSLKLGYTPTINIRTKFVAKWSVTNKDQPEPSGFNEIKNRELINVIKSIVDNDTPGRMDTRVTVYRENIERFGETTQDFRIFIFNDAASIYRTLSFWGHRLANSWRTVEFTTFLNGIMLQPFDLVLLAFTNPVLFNLFGMPGIVESTSFDPSTKLTAVKLWLPSKAGSVFIDPDVWAF